MKETWKEIPGYGGIYEVSDHGNVRSTGRQAGKRWYPARDHVLQTLPNGYVYTWLTPPGGKRVGRTVHSLVALAFIGPRPEGLYISHRNGVKTDNRLVNLNYTTPAENMRDAVIHRTQSNARKSRCKRNHRLAGRNLRPSGIRQGRRICMACSAVTANRSGLPEAEIRRLADLKYAEIMEEAWPGS